MAAPFEGEGWLTRDGDLNTAASENTGAARAFIAGPGLKCMRRQVQIQLVLDRTAVAQSAIMDCNDHVRGDATRADDTPGSPLFGPATCP
jgi:hypothetical protein